MIDITTALQNILKAIYGKDVRQSIHDAIYQINQNANEAVDLAQIKFGTDVTEPTSPVGSFINGTVYFNIATGIIWKLSGGAWTEIGSMKSIDHIERTSQTGLTDRYTVFYKDDTTDEYFVQNGVDGISVVNITKASTTDNIDHYEVNLSNGAKTPNGFDVRNGLDGVSVADVQLDSTVGATKNYKMLLSDGSTTPNTFSVNDGVSSYVYVRYSASFDGQGMVSVPTDQTVYIGICVTTQSSAPTDPAVYSWVRFIGKSGTGSGDMLKADYSTIYNNVVDKAAALYDGTEEINASQLLKKSEYATNAVAGVVDKAAGVVDIRHSKVADVSVLAELSDDGTGLKYKGDSISEVIDNATIVRDASTKALKVGNAVTWRLDDLESEAENFHGLPYDPQVTSRKGQTYTYDHKSWLCLADTSTTPNASLTQYWRQVSLKSISGEISDLNNKLGAKQSALSRFYSNKFTVTIGADGSVAVPSTAYPDGTSGKNLLFAGINTWISAKKGTEFRSFSVSMAGNPLYVCGEAGTVIVGLQLVLFYV